MARYVVEFELIENVALAFNRLDRKYGTEEDGTKRDWTEWQDVRDAIDALMQSDMERIYTK